MSRNFRDNFSTLEFFKNNSFMKIRKSTIIFLLFLIISMGFAQVKKVCQKCEVKKTNNILVTYEHTAIISDFPKPFVYKIKTNLFINDSLAQYLYNKKTKIVRSGNYQTKVGGQHYINNYYFDKKLMKEQRIMGNNTIRAKWTPDYHWTITDETKTINGFRVRKAVGNSIEVDPDDPAYFGKVYAWFTEEIPVPAGPDRYVGLPGLILEIEYEKSTRKTVVSEIKFNAKYKLKDVNGGIEVADKDDVIFYFHKHPKMIKKILKKSSWW